MADARDPPPLFDDEEEEEKLGSDVIVDEARSFTPAVPHVMLSSKLMKQRILLMCILYYKSNPVHNPKA